MQYRGSHKLMGSKGRPAHGPWDNSHVFLTCKRGRGYFNYLEKRLDTNLQ